MSDNEPVQEIRIMPYRDKAYLVKPDENDDLPRGLWGLVQFNAAGRLWCSVCEADFTEDCWHLQAISAWQKGLRTPEPVSRPSPAMWE